MWRWSADQGEEKRHPCREVLQGDVFSSILPKDTLVYSSGSEGSVPIRSFLIGIWEKAMAPHSSSCLENPMDGGAWWAAVYGVAQSRTRLKRLSRSSKQICIAQDTILFCGQKPWLWYLIFYVDLDKLFNLLCFSFIILSLK